jgi:D-alanyl-D-alanine carboxypeptidase/D-alanyl-D-alanine-endopeptidase (penicillin-binding protein 4)
MTVRGRANRAAPVFIIAVVLASGCGGPRPAVFPASPTPTATERLRQDINLLLAAPALEQGTWGILVKSLDRGDSLVSVNPNKLLLPASAMKVVTLAAAADRLGWDHTFSTRLAGGSVGADGVLEGDLVVLGSGDPSIDDWDGAATRMFQDWAAQLRTAGIRAIGGRIVGDDNSFDDEPLGAGWMWDDLDRSFATGVGALQFNQNTAQIVIIPASEPGGPAAVSIAPPTSGIVFHSQITTAPSGTSSSIATERLPGHEALEIRGVVPVDVPSVVRNTAVLNPTRYFVNELHSSLVREGFDVRGAPVDVDDISGDASAAPLTTLVEHRSPPLRTLAATMMKLSQNLYAETLLKVLGSTGGTPSAAAGLSVIASTLASWGIPPNGVIQADGSGLSRYNYATADSLVRVLVHVNRDDRLRDDFRAALPLAGRDGTLANRMTGTRAEGNARAKTGTLASARALAGYVSTADGEPLAFAILANNFGTSSDAVDQTIDAIVVRLAEFSR